MIVVDTFDIFQSLLSKLQVNDVVMDVVLADARKHPCNNDVSVILFQFLGDDTVWCWPIYHNETVVDGDTLVEWYTSFVESMRMSVGRRFVLDKKTCDQSFGTDFQLLDLNVIQYLEDGEVEDWSDVSCNAKTFIEVTHRNVTDLNRAIPLVKLASMFVDKVRRFDLNDLPEMDRSFNFVNHIAMTRFAQLESVGLAVEPTTFLSFYGPEQLPNLKDGRVFSQYNLYTSTGRPSNRFGGINFAAMNKEDGSRKPFVSRHGKDGMLVMMDYSAFHPRLIASLANYQMPFDVNPYQYLATFFYKTDKPTPPQIAAAKGQCFQQMYGGIREQFLHIPYFRSTQTYIDHRWSFFEKNGYVETPIYFRKIKTCHIDDPTPNKLFNYILQAYETEVAVQTLGRILEFLNGKKTQPVLYTYDSLLYDFHRDDGKDTLRRIRDIMVDGKFPIKAYAGKSYDEMVQITV